MHGRVVFLLEEPSMKALLLALLPRMFPDWHEQEHFLCIAHQGKSDLDKSIPKKLSAWQFPHDRFVILRDNDNADCLALKARLQQLCDTALRHDVLIRLVCQELEGWYLGDLQALSAAYANPKINSPKNVKKFADPDLWQKPSIEVSRMVPEFQKTSGARLMGALLDLDGRNNSASFSFFLSGLHRLTAEMAG